MQCQEPTGLFHLFNFPSIKTAINMDRGDNCSLKQLLLRFLRQETFNYPPLKVEAMFDKSWKISDNERYYFRCNSLKSLLNENKSKLDVVLLRNWRFHAKITADNKLVVQIEVLSMKRSPITQTVRFKGHNHSIFEDKQVAETLRLNEAKIREKTLERELKRAEKKIHKVSKQEPKECSQKYVFHKKSTRDSIEMDANTTAAKLTKAETDTSSVASNHQETDEQHSETYQNRGYLSSDITFFEAATVKPHRYVNMGNQVIHELDRNASKLMNSKRNGDLKERLLDQDEATALFSRAPEVPHWLLQDPIVPVEILTAINQGLISWKEINFTQQAVEALINGADTLFK